MICCLLSGNPDSVPADFRPAMEKALRAKLVYADQQLPEGEPDDVIESQIDALFAAWAKGGVPVVKGKPQ